MVLIAYVNFNSIQMLIKDFIEILKTFPPEDHPKFWCAQEQQYYWFLGTLSRTHNARIIVIDIEQPFKQEDYQTYEYLSNVFLECEKHQDVNFTQAFNRKKIFTATHQDNLQTVTSPPP